MTCGRSLRREAIQSTDRPPIHLTILCRGDTNIVDLDEVDVLIPRSETQVDGAFLQEIAEEVVRLTAPGYNRGESRDVRGTLAEKPEAAVQDLQRIGSLIYSHLLTEPARRKLRTADPCELYLRLDEQLIHGSGWAASHHWIRDSHPQCETHGDWDATRPPRC